MDMVHLVAFLDKKLQSCYQSVIATAVSKVKNNIFSQHEKDHNGIWSKAPQQLQNWLCGDF